MQPVLRTIERVAPSDANVLITGEHGTGKDIVAQYLHAASKRADKELVTVNAGALSDGIAESELFGHVKGAFTDARSERVGCFELAHRGTLFLDEIATMGPRLQAKLLRVLQSGELQRVGASRTLRVDVRVIAATNADLLDEIDAGRFREDLLFRLNTIELHVPPLRDRKDDILPLAIHFLRVYTARHARQVSGFERNAESTLLAHAWRGNVRELEHAVERAVLMAHGGLITTRDLNLQPCTSTSEWPHARRIHKKHRYIAPDEPAQERINIVNALRQTRGNKARAAPLLNMCRSLLYERIRLHRIEEPEWRDGSDPYQSNRPA